jgi:uncharacterized protein (DUF488 family)
MAVVYTIGHSTHPIDEFLLILNTYSINLLTDIRTVPRSRHNPQYEQAEFRESLRRKNIGYVHMPSLGGLRHARKDSVNTGWKNASFRGYADYMQTKEFGVAMAELVALAEKGRTAIMCAEAVPWRCHRSLVSDALLVRGVEVIDILSGTNAKPHKITPWAVVQDQQITYPSGN